MALNQVQIIQSLGEALTWFERELSWGVEMAELRHLTGRIGELYAATITFGTMAEQTNQRGYDVVGGDDERISVKTITSSNHVTFNANTFDFATRVMIFRVDNDDDKGITIDILLDKPASEVRQLCSPTKDGKLRYVIPAANPRPARPLDDLAVVAQARFGELELRQYENGTINVLRDGSVLAPAKEHLRRIASDLNYDIFWDTGAPKNTRHLGAALIKLLNSRPTTPNSPAPR